LVQAAPKNNILYWSLLLGMEAEEAVEAEAC
jgi:hypothetical protein